MRLPDRSRRGERGAIAIIVAICAIVLFGMAAFALDTGNGWQTRRQLITATDAAALASAQEFAVGEDGCDTTPATFVSANVVDASVTGCSFTDLGPGAGYVTVDAERTVDFTFARVFGIDGRQVHSTTTAAYGQPISVTGLRPFGLCNQSDRLLDWLDRRHADTVHGGHDPVHQGQPRRLRREPPRATGASSTSTAGPTPTTTPRTGSRTATRARWNPGRPSPATPARSATLSTPSSTT